jgi:hypothetical protein
VRKVILYPTNSNQLDFVGKKKKDMAHAPINSSSSRTESQELTTGARPWSRCYVEAYDFLAASLVSDIFVNGRYYYEMVHHHQSFGFNSLRISKPDLPHHAVDVYLEGRSLRVAKGETSSGVTKRRELAEAQAA